MPENDPTDPTDDEAVTAVDEEVEVWPAAEDLTDTAKSLLAAADELGQPVHVVQSIGPGGFRVPKSVADKAGIVPDDQDDELDDKPPAKPRAPRKQTARTPSAAVEKGAAPGGGDA